MTGSWNNRLRKWSIPRSNDKMTFTQNVSKTKWLIESDIYRQNASITEWLKSSRQKWLRDKMPERLNDC